jgi:hypothetical protein
MIRQMALAFGTFLLLLLGGCSFTGAPNPGQAKAFCSQLEDLPVTQSILSLADVLETPGVIKVMHGRGTAVLDHGDFVKVEHTAEIPSYANQATVLLNGWKMEYRGDDDQNVHSLGTLVGRIRREGTKLTWNAAGLLRDADGHEAFAWTYHFTVIVWNDAALNVLVNHDDADNFCKSGSGVSDNFYFATNRGTDTALSSFSSFVYDPRFPPSGPVAVLPRGFGFSYGDGADFNLLQLAYNLDHSESLAEYNKMYRKAFDEVTAPLPNPASLAGGGFASWTTYSILKDNGRRDLLFGELVTVFGGGDVGAIEPPFAILPRDNVSGGCVPPSAPLPEEVVIENVPFEYAVPVLTGWDLTYFCDDENVKEVGVWIDQWGYSKDPAAPTGTLRYNLASSLRDKDGSPGHVRRHQVTILGLRPTADARPPRPR